MKGHACRVQKPKGLGNSLAPVQVWFWVLPLESCIAVTQSKCSVNNTAVFVVVVVVVIIIIIVLSLLLMISFSRTNHFKITFPCFCQLSAAQIEWKTRETTFFLF